MFKSPFPVIVLGCAVVTALASPTVRAVEIERQEVRLSADVCQPSRPGVDSTFRRRPLAMQNEGTSTVFLTCAFGGVFNGVPSQKTLSVGFTNANAVPVTVNCTLVDAQDGVINPEFFPKSISVAAAGSPVTLMQWSAVADNGGVEFTYPAVSCAIPAGIGVQVTLHTFDEEIGN
jgi:hypothetical protein